MSLDRKLYQRIIEDYARTQSVEQTARNCHCARVTAQKVLITEGLWSSRTSIAVGELRKEGKSVKEIAGELCLTEKTVQAYTPYSRGMYGVETEDARHSQDYRDRMNAAAGRMAVKEDIAEMRADHAALSEQETDGKGNSFEEQGTDGEGNSFEGQETDGKGNSFEEQGADGKGNSFEEQEAVMEENLSAKEDAGEGEETLRQEVQDMHGEWLEHVEQEELRKPLTSDTAWAALSVSEEEAFRIADEEQKTDWSNRKIYHLHLELQSRDWDNQGSTGLERYFAAEEWEEFRRLAKAERGITRDILVPGDMNLHALHYAIQQVFGWQNSHLHRFLLGEKDYDRLTAGRVGGYQDLVGILFRCEDESFDDLYWDDDYRPEMSVKTWMKRKYSRPFRHYAATDTRYVGQRYTEEFCARHPEVTRDMRHRTLDLPFDFCNDLVEGLRVEDVFTEDGCRTWSDAAARRWKAHVIAEATDQEALFEDLVLDAWAEQGNADRERWGAAAQNRPGKKGTGAEIIDIETVKAQLDNAVRELKSWRSSRSQIEQGLDADRQLDTKEFHRRIRRETGMTAERVLLANEENVKYWTDICMPLFEDYVVRPLPFTNELLYNYDYGDDWWVSITLVRDNNVPPELLDAVAEKGAPVCIAADGLNLVDDVGGLGGFLEFLQTVYGDDPDEKAEMKAWARYMGWTGRRKKVENIL